mmetsp:Transcript_9990/g.13575  ORF Transcript_9990/g.13575 Transcript_9990/m.13575 type:complete len:111 (-) Transcript_9990:343-675(-)|eukprot:CAMPEP_0176369144 /NCGR_PEP_ID=MMETSP0126-20121128/23086_1 /TAXON_ID=141414 ORGANISM="Strombidinopsis acuminatum, Strain SPMC142" /NCGR_SAMPLE_ID=MMETSP0126 /ASSEMBLY_ACC=CAM_ASM_000229 /LENGTH=110 /DNA_ID=CAMNT_0017727671 /DNA_START=54 /DNA_END=386 /DNA_ORIENTATION=+
MINPNDFKEGELEAINNQLIKFQESPEELTESIQKYFTEFDEDKNGFLDQKELRHFLTLFFQQFHIHAPITDEYVDAMFRQIDTNHDNKIQPEELVNYAAKFVGQFSQHY